MKKILFVFILITAAGTVILLEALKQPGKIEEIPRKDKPYLFCAPSFNVKDIESKAPLINGLGNLQYKVTTNSKLAQKYFNQGLTLLYAFNHGEAARSFRYATKLDSSCAMAWWGLAQVLGPNYNAALDPSNLIDINTAINNAMAFSTNATAKEKSLIEALVKRYPAEEVKDMSPYNEAYALAMEAVYEKFPNDPEVAVLYIDAIMNVHPWNLWNKDGSPQPWTSEIVEFIEKTLARWPNHIGAMHYYIHATEASKNAARALPYADKLATALPGAGHLVHMPSHTYIRTGHYHKGVLVNESASAADSSYIAQCSASGFYPLLLYPHNVHFLAACAYLEGNSKKAIENAWRVSAIAEKKYLAELATVQHYYIIPYYTLVSLGKWDDILKIKQPDESLKYPNAIWHYARGMAFAGKKDFASANKELQLVKTAAADETLKKILIWDINNVLELINIAAFTLEAEIEGQRENYSTAILLVKRAVEIEDRLAYTEPPDWFFSVRLALGHWLVKAKRFAEAEDIYRQDLVTFPENGWALMGLYNSLKGQGSDEEAKGVKQRFDKAWQWSDIKISSSRIQ